jgi:hypothetical protein
VNVPRAARGSALLALLLLVLAGSASGQDERSLRVRLQ